MKKVIAMILLLLVLAGSVFGTLTLRSRTRTMLQEQEALIAAAQARLEEAETARDAVDPTTAEGQERLLSAERDALAAARAHAGELQTEIAGMEEEILRSEQELETMRQDEETAYYLAMYESYHTGMEMVEGYLNEDG